MASVKPLVDKIKEQLLQSPVVHMDETGIDVLPKCQWVHVYSTLDETFYGLQPKRGKEAMDARGKRKSICTRKPKYLCLEQWENAYD